MPAHIDPIQTPLDQASSTKTSCAETPTSAAYTPIPTQWVGPLQIHCGTALESISVPMATYETPLWPSTARGARVTAQAGGIFTSVLSQTMTRSIYFRTPGAVWTATHRTYLTRERARLEAVTASTSRFATLAHVHDEAMGDLWFIRFQFQTGDASGHNMATKAAQALQTHLLETFPDLQYGSISGNLCVDKKNSSINGILGRGTHVIAEVTLSRALCQRFLRSTPQKIQTLVYEKNWIGSMLSGGVRTANAHFANALLAMYLATGQDAANIVEASQGFTFARVTEDDQLYFSVSLPHLIVGTVGNGKDLTFIAENLDRLGCLIPQDPGINRERLARIMAATVLCSELSLLAAQTHPGELVRSHLAIERRERTKGVSES